MENNLNNFDFSPGRKLDTEDFDFYKPIKKLRKWDLVGELLFVYYGNWEIFLRMDWYSYSIGTKKSGSFHIKLLSTKFENGILFLKKTRRMSRLRKYILEAHQYAIELLGKFDNPDFQYKDYFLTESQIKIIKNSPPDTFMNEYPQR